MESPIQAIRNLKVPYNQKFSCDNSEHVQATIKAFFLHGTFYKDINTRNNHETAEVDLYVAGFPCQAFSTAGKQKGFSDGRGTIFFRVLDYIENADLRCSSSKTPRD